MAYFDNKQKLITNMGLSVCVFIIAFIYCLCKILIALKLSYTYPYFEKISEINVISVSLSLVFIFVLYSMFSQRFFRTIDNKRNIKNRPRLLFPTSALSLFFSLIGFSLILALWHFNVDNGFSANVLMSYMKEDLFTLNIFDWTTLSGMNDTHRSVLYALSMFIIVAMFITLLMHISVVRRCFYALFHSDSVSNKKMWIVIIITAGLLFSCILLPGNFATAFITLVLVIGLSLALACVDYDKPLRAFMSIIVMVVLFGMFSILPDNGYITNWGGVLLAICWLVVLNSVKLSNYVNKDHKKSYIWLAVSTFVFMALLVSGSVLYIMNKSDNNNVNYDRMNRRFDLLLNYNDVKDKGFRYSESDVEFMVVMAHYMQNNNGDDPLSNDKHLLHPSISTGQSPVVLNDVSIQSSFFSAYGWKAKAVYFTLLLLLVFTVCFYVNYSSERETSIGMVRTYYSVGTMDVRRMLAVFMWVGTSLYLYMSYCGYLPFTGRLNPGFGVDSVGEVLESALLIAFMMSEDVK